MIFGGKERGLAMTMRAVLIAAAGLLVAAGPSMAQRVVPLTEDMDMASKSAPAAEVLTIPLGKAQRIDLPQPVRDVVVAKPDVADVIVKTPDQIYLVGQSIGETNIFFVSQDGSVVKHLEVTVDVDLDAARAALKALMPDSNITLRDMNGSVVMSGSVRSAKDSVDAGNLVSRYYDQGGGEGQKHVINMLRVTEDQQVLLKVRVAEMQRSTLKTLGFNTDFGRSIGSQSFNAVANGASDVVNSIASGSILIDELGFRGVSFSTLEQQGLVKTLAEPVLTAISGETANFLAGGELPVPSGVDRNGNLSFSFRDFGVSLSFTPVVLSDKQVSLRVNVEVSRRSADNSLTLSLAGGGSVTIDGYSTRRADSTVTLPSGGNLMIAGLLQSDDIGTVKGVPGLKDLPILGALFRSTSFQHSDTELVILVSPYRVASTDARRPLGLPTDGYVSPNDMDLYLLGRLHKQYSGKEQLDTLPSVFGPFGYVIQ